MEAAEDGSYERNVLCLKNVSENENKFCRDATLSVIRDLSYKYFTVAILRYVL